MVEPVSGSSAHVRGIWSSGFVALSGTPVHAAVRAFARRFRAAAGNCKECDRFLYGKEQRAERPLVWLDMSLVDQDLNVSRHDDIMKGLGLHGQAVVAALEMMVDLGKRNPGLDQVASRIGAEPGTLRRIFPDDDSLMIAVAEQALIRLMDSCTKAVVKINPDDAVGQFLALGNAYIRWAADHSVQFRIISSHPTLNADKVPELRRYVDSVVDLMTRMLERARTAGRLRDDEDIPRLVLSSRIFAHGLAQMVVDGRVDAWLPARTPLEAAEQALADFVKRIARASAKHSLSRG
jgi:AcrR family transcriptional regulator